MNLDQLVDVFVARMNAHAPSDVPLAEVPVPLRVPSVDEFGEELQGFTGWQMIPFDHASRIAKLEQRTGRPFPPSFRNLICRYSFPAFECGPVMFFSNTGEPLFWELEDKLFLDPSMSPFLLHAGYLQIGNPMFSNYDPVCLQVRPEGVEGAVVRIDHEAILCHQKLVIRQTLAPSFAQLLEGILESEA